MYISLILNLRLFEMRKEIWKNIEGYEGLYQVSNSGRVRSLDRYIEHKQSGTTFRRGRVLKQSKSNNEYARVTLSKDGVLKYYTVHKLVAMIFLNHRPCGHKLVINHINFNKQDNRIENLEIITQRENSNQKHLNSNSKHTGVCLVKKRNKWTSNIWIGSKQVYLGIYKNEHIAHIRYELEYAKIKSLDI